MQICGIKYNLYCLVYNKKNYDLILIFYEYEYKYIQVEKKRANMSTNIFGLNKKGKYIYKYFCDDKKGE